MAKSIHKGMRKAVETVARKARAGRSSCVMKPEYLAEIARFRLMDDDLWCRDAVEMYFDILRKQVSQFKNSEEGRHTMCRAIERIAERNKAEGKAEGIVEGEARGKRETMFATAKRLLANGKLMLKEIAECTGLSLAQVKKLQASMA